MKPIKDVLSGMFSDLLGSFIVVLATVVIAAVVSPIVVVAIKPYIENVSLRRENVSLLKQQSWYQSELRKLIIPDTTNIGNRRDYSKFKVK